MAVNDEIYKNLAQYGGDTINERVYNYLGSLGYTGTINDRLAQYSSEGRKGWQGLIRAFGGLGWTPAALFAQGEQGMWYEPKPEYLFQDAAGTVPVTADGDPVGYMQDLSGNGNHATQSTSAARPVFPGVEFDGVDDHLLTDLRVDGATFGNGFLWSFWARWDTVDANTGSNGGVGNAPRMYTQIEAGPQLRHATGSEFMTTGVTPIVGKWHHVAFLFDGSESKMYFDGELRHTMTTTFSGDSGHAFALGIGFNRERHMNGAIADNVIASGSWSEKEVARLYEYGKWRKSL
jgi:hypothetical protein